jgi:hypothetical protein
VEAAAAGPAPTAVSSAIRAMKTIVPGKLGRVIFLLRTA